MGMAEKLVRHHQLACAITGIRRARHPLIGLSEAHYETNLFKGDTSLHECQKLEKTALVDSHAILYTMLFNLRPKFTVGACSVCWPSF